MRNPDIGAEGYVEPLPKPRVLVKRTRGAARSSKRSWCWRPATSASDALAAELREHVKTVTAPYKYPREIEFVADLPKTISGKIRRTELRDME